MAPSVDGLIHNANVENRPERTQSSTNPVTGGRLPGKVSVGNEVCGGYGRQRQTGVSQQQAVRQRP